MKRSALVFVLVIALFSLSGSLFAHHGSAAYADKLTTFKEATVTKLVWGNPHTIVMFDAKDDKGTLTHWAAEAGSPSALTLIGWSKASVQPGDVVTVYLFAAKSGNPAGRLNKIVLADGTTLRDSQLGADGYKGSNQPQQ